MEYLQSTVLIAVLLLLFYFVFKLYLISRLFLIEFAIFRIHIPFPLPGLSSIMYLKLTGQRVLTR